MVFQATGEQRIDAIDGLRGFAALYVLVFHQFQLVDFGSPIVNQLTRYGTAAVYLFFGVSGFLLFPRIARESQSNRKWKFDFYVRRVFRIVPLWWALLAVQFVHLKMAFSVLFANAFFGFGFLSFDPRYLPIIPAWSLFVEEWFYLVLPWLMRFLRCGADIALMLAGSVLVSFFWKRFASAWGVPVGEFFISRAPFANMEYFFVGILVAFAQKNCALQAWLQNDCRSGRAVCLGLIALIAFFGPAFGCSVPSELGIALVLLAALSERTFISMALRWRPLRTVGKRCYAIYISQEVLDELFSPIKERFAAHFGLQGNALQLFWFPVFLLSVLAIAEISWVSWELPWQRVGRWLIERNRLRTEASVDPITT